MTDTTNDAQSTQADRRLLHWVRAVDRLAHEHVADAFAAEDPHSHEAARARAAEVAHELRDRIEGLVSPEDYATTIASLEAIARGLGWDDTAADLTGGRGRRRNGHGGFGPHGHRGFGRHRHGFDPRMRGFGRGFGPGFGPAFRPGFGPAPDASDPVPHHGCRHAGEDSVSR